MKTLLIFLVTLSFMGCVTSTSRVYDSDYTKTNRDIVLHHLLDGSKAIPDAKLTNESLDSSSYRIEYSQGENCSGFVLVKSYSDHKLKVSVNYGCVDLKHKNKTREEFLDELGGVLH